MRLDSFQPPRDLAEAVTAPDFLERLHRLQIEFPLSPFPALATWDQVRRQIERVTIWNKESDALLRPILIVARREPDACWPQILLFLCWRGLASIARRLRYLDKDPNALDAQVYWMFLRIVCRLDPARREARLGQKIINDVRHEVRERYDREDAPIDQASELVDEQPDDDGEEPGSAEIRGDEDRAFAVAEACHDVSWGRARLKALVRRGRLSGPDYLILIGCHLYSRSLGEMATRLGLSYEAAKKRQQRTAKILRENARFLSPAPPRTPLKGIGRAARGRRSHE